MKLKNLFSKPEHFFSDIKSEKFKIHIVRYIWFYIIGFVLLSFQTLIQVMNRSLYSEDILVWRYIFENPALILIGKLLIMFLLIFVVLLIITLLFASITKFICWISKTNVSFKDIWVIMTYSFMFIVVLGQVIGIIPYLISLFSIQIYELSLNIILVIQYLLLVYFVFLTVKGIKVFKAK